MGALHAQNLAVRVPGAQLVLVADPDPNGAAERCAKPLGARFTTDVHAALADPQIDAVVISTPTSMHVELIVAAARAGKQIFCEKPVSTDPARIDQALEAARAAGVQLQIGFNRRFDPSFQRAKRFVD
jgi:myo-inositol 2-dehydrogenase/D-chiro-inositol 1-dehydrogenase